MIRYCTDCKALVKILHPGSHFSYVDTIAWTEGYPKWVFTQELIYPFSTYLEQIESL